MDIKQRILVVDDEYYIRDILKQVLNSEGYDVFCVGEGETAVSAVEDGEFDLVLLDFNLGGMNGTQVLKKIRELDDDIPVIFVSGSITVDDIIGASRHKLFSYMSKPFDIDDLINSVKRALDNKREKSLKTDHVPC